jgi:hypothetical protein
VWSVAPISGRRHETAFMNGPSIREIDGRFWLSYWAVGGGGFFGMYHAVADDPLGPVPARGTSGLAGQRVEERATGADGPAN